MSNTVYLDSMKFTNKKGAVSYGFLVRDSYGYDYCNTLEEMVVDDLQLLKICIEKDFAHDHINHISQYELGIIINGTKYHWAEIHHLWKDD